MFADPANVTDSPDLGPPPVAHFDEGDPIKFDARVERLASRALSEPTERSHATLPANLETRKKRREKFDHREVGDQQSSTRPSQEVASKDPGTAPTQPLNSGAKRKLNMRDEENQPGIPDDHEKDVFQLDRRIADSRASESAVAKPNLNRTNKLAIEKEMQPAAGGAQIRRDRATEAPFMVTSSNRKALGPSESVSMITRQDCHLTSLQRVLIPIL